MVSECMIATLPLQCVLDFHTLVHQVRFQTSPQPRPHALEVRSLSSVIRCFHFLVQKRAKTSSTTRPVRSSSILALLFLVSRKRRMVRGGFLLMRKRRKRTKGSQPALSDWFLGRRDRVGWKLVAAGATSHGTAIVVLFSLLSSLSLPISSVYDVSVGYVC